MFTSIVMVFKMSEIAIYFVFSAENSKKFVTVWEIYLSTKEDNIELLQKMLWLIGFGLNCS